LLGLVVKVDRLVEMLVLVEHTLEMVVVMVVLEVLQIVFKVEAVEQEGTLVTVETD